MYQLYNVTEEWHPMSKEEFMQRQKAAFEEGRQVGFRAGYAAAQQQPNEKIQHAYNQGVKDTLVKKGCGY